MMADEEENAAQGANDVSAHMNAGRSRAGESRDAGAAPMGLPRSVGDEVVKEDGERQDRGEKRGERNGVVGRDTGDAKALTADGLDEEHRQVCLVVENVLGLLAYQVLARCV